MLDASQNYVKIIVGVAAQINNQKSTSDNMNAESELQISTDTTINPQIGSGGGLIDETQPSDTIDALDPINTSVVNGASTKCECP